MSNESMGSLRRERDYCRQQAVVHSRAADDANRLAERLSGSISIANNKIAAVNNYLSGLVSRLDGADADLSDALLRVAASVGKFGSEISINAALSAGLAAFSLTAGPFAPIVFVGAELIVGAIASHVGDSIGSQLGNRLFE